jgi:hypothetical protein
MKKNYNFIIEITIKPSIYAMLPELKEKISGNKVLVCSILNLRFTKCSNSGKQYYSWKPGKNLDEGHGKSRHVFHG